VNEPLRGVLLASDLDGTLVGSDYSIARRNLDAISRFMKKGGLFTVATGRTMISGRRFLAQLKPNVPCILINGTLLYDVDRGEVVAEQCLEESARPVIRRLMNAFPTLGVEAFCGKDVYLLRGNERVRRQILKDQLTAISAELEDFPIARCHKFLLSDDPPVISAAKVFTSAIRHDKLYFVTSSSHYLEMMRAGVHKGTGLAALAERLGVERQHIYAIGDYHNDIEMLETAAVSACPSNAPGEIREKAKIEVGHCDNGAVADFIEYIEEIYSA